MESLPRLIVPGAPQPGFNPQPLILGTGQPLPGIGQGMDPRILTPEQLAVEEQKHRWFLSQLPYPLARVQPLERDIGPQAPVPAWGELPVVDWRSKLYDTPPSAAADPDAAVADAVGRRSDGRRVRRNGRLYTGSEAVNRLPMGDLSARQAAGASLPVALVDAAPQLAAVAPADNGVNRPGAGGQQQQGMLVPARHAGRAVGRGAFGGQWFDVDGVYFRDKAVGSSSPLGNAAKIEGAIAGTQSQPMAPGSGGPVLTAPDSPADNGVNRPGAGAAAGDGISALDVAVLGAESLADPVISNVSDGGPGTSTAKGNSAIDAKLNQRIKAFLARNGVTPASPYQLPLRTGMSAGTTAAAPATVAAAGGGSPPNEPPSTPLDDLVDDAANPAGRAPRGATAPAFGDVDLGIGKMTGDQLDNLAATKWAQGSPQLANALKGLGRGARFLAPAAAVAAPLIPVAMGAAEGAEQAGVGGAVIQGGSAALGGLAGGALAGALAGSVVPGFGTVIGGIVGGLGGMALGKGATGLAQGAVDAAQGGDTGLMGQIGRTLDPVIDSEYERQQRQVMRDMNSPAMKAIELQQQRREAQARADRAQALLMQSYLS